MPLPSERIDLRLTPYNQDQELPLAVTYWEGATRVEGSTTGHAPMSN